MTPGASRMRLGGSARSGEAIIARRIAVNASLMINRVAPLFIGWALETGPVETARLAWARIPAQVFLLVRLASQASEPRNPARQSLELQVGPARLTLEAASSTFLLAPRAVPGTRRDRASAGNQVEQGILAGDPVAGES